MNKLVSDTNQDQIEGKKEGLRVYTEYFPLTEDQFHQAETLGISHDRLQGIQRRMIEGKALYQKISKSRAQYEESKKSPTFLGHKHIPNTMWGETYKKWGEILIKQNTNTWEEQFLTMYYYLNFPENQFDQNLYFEKPIQNNIEHISHEIEEYRSFLFLVHLYHEIPEIKRLPRMETIRLWKRENNDLYLDYLSLCRKYYETRKGGADIVFIPHADYNGSYRLYQYILQRGEKGDVHKRGEKGDVHKRVFPNMGIIPQVKMSLHVDFLEEIYVLGGWVIDAIGASQEIFDNFIRRHAERLDQNIDALSPLTFDPQGQKHIQDVIRQHKERQEKQKNLGQGTRKLSTGIQKKVHQIELKPIEEKKVTYDYSPEIQKTGIYKKYKRKAIDLVKKWEKEDGRKFWIFSVQENIWKSYERDEEIFHESTPSGEYEFCFAFEDLENIGFPSIDPVKKVKYTIENEKKVSNHPIPLPVKSLEKGVIKKVDMVIKKEIPTQTVLLNQQEEDALMVLSLVEDGNYSMRLSGEKIIFQIGETSIAYNFQKDHIDAQNPHIEPLCGDILREGAHSFMKELETSKREHEKRRREKYIIKQLDQIQGIETGMGEYFDTLSQEDISFGEYVGTHDDIFLPFRSVTGGFLGARILHQTGILHQYRFALQKIFHQNHITLGWYRPMTPDKSSSLELTISLQRRNGSKVLIQSVPKAPYYAFTFPDGMDYRIQEGWSRILKNILILVGEVSRRSMFPKNTKEYRSLPNKEKMEAYIAGSFQKEYSWEKLPGKEREIRLEAYKRLLQEKGKIITDTGEIKTRQGLGDISEDTKIIVHDMSIKPGFTEEGSKMAYEMIRDGESRLKRYLIKRIFATLNQGTLDGKRVFSNGMGYFFQAFWKELPENIRKELIEISQTGEGSTDRAMEIQYGQKTLIDALLDYWESHNVLLSISSPSSISGKDILDNISFLKLSQTD